MEKNSTEEFEKKVFSVLKDMRFTTVGYYPYSHCIDIIGYMKPQPPFTINTKAVVEIAKNKLTTDKVESFYKIAQDALADKIIIFADKEFEKLDTKVQRLITKSKIEYFGGKVLNTLSSQMKA